MFCVKCGKELPDDANFCLKCGNPVNASAPVRQSTPEQWETCDITVEFSGYHLLRPKYEFKAYAVGPTGRYLHMAGVEFVIGKDDDVNADRIGTQSGPKEALDSVVNGLIRDQGWESVGRGPYWYSYRFRRSMSKQAEMASRAVAASQTPSQNTPPRARKDYNPFQGISICSNCGSTAKNNADSCPKCGATFSAS